MKKHIIKQFNDRAKTMPILSFPSVQLMDINVMDLINNSEHQAKGMKLIADKCPISASVSMMDLSVEAEAFGANVKFSEMEIPTITGILLSSEDEIDALSVPEVGAGRTGTYVDAIGKARRLIQDKPVFAGVIGPFSLAGRLMDMTEIMVNCYTEPQMVHKTLAKVSEFIVKYIKAYKAVGADGVLMAEPAAGLLSPSLCEEFSTKYIKNILNEIKDDSFVFIYHNCGNVVPLADSIISLDADVYHFGNSVDIEDMLKIMPKDKLIMGNIDPILFLNGTIDEVKAVTNSILKKCSKYENFVISSGCDVPPLAKWENITAYFETIEKFYSNK